MTTTVTSKGQITLPKAIRDRLALKPGDKVEFVIVDDGVRLVPVTQPVSAFKGRVPPPERSVSLEEMEAAIEGGRGES